MALFSSIIGRHSHVNALMLMGIADETTKFPAVLTCPCCGKSALYVYDDTSREDLWLACEACSVHGNIITFAALIWKLDISQTIARFDENRLCIRRHTVDDISGLVKVVTRQAATLKFWELAKKQLWNHGDDGIDQKMREFGVSKEIDCAGLVGVALPEQVSELCPLIHRSFPDNLNKAPVIVFPFCDLPQRFSGFMLMQYGEEVAGRRAFLSISRSSRYKPEAGYYLLQTALLPPCKELNQSYFIVDDPVWALKAQTIQIRHGLGLLPICASYLGREATSYGITLSMFPHSRRFFSARVVTPALISQAAAGRGYVCTPPEKRSMHADMPIKTVERLANICRAAVTWQTALSVVFNTSNPIAARSFAEELNISRERLQRFFQDKTTLPKDTITKILEKTVPHHGVDHVRYRTKDIIERDNAWYTTGGEQVCNVSPVITSIIFAGPRDKYYEGYIKKDSNTYEFFEKAYVIERAGLLVYISQLMAEHGELVIHTGNHRGWNARALATALTLHAPKVVHVSADPGWHERAQEFQFRNYSIKSDGAITPTRCPELCKENPVDFPEPTSAVPDSIHELLTPTHENATVWALTAVALSHMVAPILAMSPNSFAVGSDVFAQLIALAPSVGCHVDTVGVPGRRAGPGNTVGLTQALTLGISWPTFITMLSDDDRALINGLVKGAYSPVLLKMSPQSVVTALTFDWYAIRPIKVPEPTLDTSSLQFIIPAYIQRIMRARLAVKPGEALVYAILADLHKWLEHTYNASFNLAAAERVILSPRIAHIVFMQDISAAIDAGDLNLLPRPRNSRQRRNYIVRNKKHWWINKRAITDYFNQKSGVVPEWNALINCFVKEGVFVGEHSIEKLSGILLDKAWCDTFRDPAGPQDSTPREIKDVG